MLHRLLTKYFFRIEDELLVTIGSEVQMGSMFVTLKFKELWEKETLKQRIKLLISRKWNPSEVILQTRAKEAFMRDVFGKQSDYGEELFALVAWHNSRIWDISCLTENDQIKANALESMTILTRMRYQECEDILHLNLFDRSPDMCLLAFPLVAKTPIISIQYFLSIHCSYTFNSVRKAKHPSADSIIDFLYEILYLQQKIAISLHEFLRLINYSESKKKDSMFINAEINAIMGADLVFSYLKASVEKIVSLIGVTHQIINLDSKPKHKAKINALKEGLPKDLLNNYYVQFMFEYFSSENLEELNNYRSGLLHKKGIADLQPHSYVGRNADAIPLRRIFEILHEQHSKNTAVLMGALAILTDKLVDLDPPEIKHENIPRPKFS